MENILDKRSTNSGILEYLIKCENMDETSWVAAADLEPFNDVIEEFERAEVQHHCGGDDVIGEYDHVQKKDKNSCLIM